MRSAGPDSATADGTDDAVLTREELSLLLTWFASVGDQRFLWEATPEDHALAAKINAHLGYPS